MRRSPQSCAVVDGRTVIIPDSKISFTRVQCYAHTQRLLQWPGLLDHRDLNGARGRHAIRGSTKNRETAVAFAPRSDHLPAIGSYQAFNQRIVPRQYGAHCVGVADPGAGAALDVGEQKGNGPGGQHGVTVAPGSADAKYALTNSIELADALSRLHYGGGGPSVLLAASKNWVVRMSAGLTTLLSAPV
jgi:hypothetical protein